MDMGRHDTAMSPHFAINGLVAQLPRLRPQRMFSAMATWRVWRRADQCVTVRANNSPCRGRRHLEQARRDMSASRSDPKFAYLESQIPPSQFSSQFSPIRARNASRRISRNAHQQCAPNESRKKRPRSVGPLRGRSTSLCESLRNALLLAGTRRAWPSRTAPRSKMDDWCQRGWNIGD
jgi:hypothetical protein